MTPLEVYEKADVDSLPVDPISAANALGIKVISYSSFLSIADVDIENLYKKSREGFSFKYGEQYCIVINERSCGEKRRRFTIAHELGHIVLGHLELPEITKKCENEANFFASEFLAPPAVLEACGVNSAAEISKICGISAGCAEIVFSNLYKKCNSKYKNLVKNRFSDYILLYNSAKQYIV